LGVLFLLLDPLFDVQGPAATAQVLTSHSLRRLGPMAAWDPIILISQVLYHFL
jgi:hypothetical protein